MTRRMRPADPLRCCRWRKRSELNAQGLMLARFRDGCRRQSACSSSWRRIDELHACAAVCGGFRLAAGPIPALAILRIRCTLARARGFEPRHRGSKPRGLPLADTRIVLVRSVGIAPTTPAWRADALLLRHDLVYQAPAVSGRLVGPPGRFRACSSRFSDGRAHQLRYRWFGQIVEICDLALSGAPAGFRPPDCCSTGSHDAISPPGQGGVARRARTCISTFGRWRLIRFGESDPRLGSAGGIGSPGPTCAVALRRPRTLRRKELATAPRLALGISALGRRRSVA